VTALRRRSYSHTLRRSQSPNRTQFRPTPPRPDRRRARRPTRPRVATVRRSANADEQRGRRVQVGRAIGSGISAGAGSESACTPKASVREHCWRSAELESHDLLPTVTEESDPGPSVIERQRQPRGSTKCLPRNAPCRAVPRAQSPERWHVHVCHASNIVTLATSRPPWHEEETQTKLDQSD
jgi:hypothetical protein